MFQHAGEKGCKDSENLQNEIFKSFILKTKVVKNIIFKVLLNLQRFIQIMISFAKYL